MLSLRKIIMWACLGLSVMSYGAIAQDEITDEATESSASEQLMLKEPYLSLYHALQNRLHEIDSLSGEQKQNKQQSREQKQSRKGAMGVAYYDVFELLGFKDDNETKAEIKSSDNDISMALTDVDGTFHGNGTVIKMGDIHPDMPFIRARLSGYLNVDYIPTDPTIYDEALFQAVKAFQRDFGLKDDGIIGPATISILNRSLEDERKQILVNIHRLEQPEWQNRPDLRIDVDVVRYWLQAYEGGQIVFEMPVVVGTKDRQTNIFSTVMNGVRLNPGWTVPPTIKAEDYIPKLREDPQWVTDKGVLIYTSWEQDALPIDPTLVDWNYLTDNEIKAMRFYKKAGDSNPLGYYRFLMNNKYDIYLHDTNQRYMFGQSDRAKSSGCARVYDPHKIAVFLLKDNPGWTSEKIDAVLAEGETYNVRAKRSVPVYFDYKTAWVNDAGKLVLGVDIYDLDDAVYRDSLNKKGISSDSDNKNLEE